MSTPESPAEPFVHKAAKPSLRTVEKRGEKWFELAAFTQNLNPNTKHLFSGPIDINGDGKRVNAFGFVHDRHDNSGRKVISLTAHLTNEQTGEMGYQQIAVGSVVNHRADNKDVYFDTVLFNPVTPDGEKIPGANTVAVYVTDDCPADLHAKLGFSEPRVPRPPKEQAADTLSEGDPAGDDAAKPRAPRP